MKKSLLFLLLTSSALADSPILIKQWVQDYVWSVVGSSSKEPGAPAQGLSSPRAYHVTTLCSRGEKDWSSYCTSTDARIRKALLSEGWTVEPQEILSNKPTSSQDAFMVTYSARRGSEKLRIYFTARMTPGDLVSVSYVQSEL